eukprot:gnl/TRDRNA2_/TRDRNA2_95052_c0_seq2.p1 gnl/TRDRNA2_/TRDRNA2_95052_c0~~gnl/TRDRNA2_/TRDRNA2_95052_c0_seq2.p1  ORF type:complete len:180 (-),score=20.69 gnl/TRDRNA2_/TRDRNA2_95052_c0_seq2:13-552(-)
MLVAFKISGHQAMNAHIVLLVLLRSMAEFSSEADRQMIRGDGGDLCSGIDENHTEARWMTKEQCESVKTAQGEPCCVWYKGIFRLEKHFVCMPINSFEQPDECFSPPLPDSDDYDDLIQRETDRRAFRCVAIGCFVLTLFVVTSRVLQVRRDATASAPLLACQKNPELHSSSPLRRETS